MIYLASSWRNGLQPAMVTALRELGHDVYDFRHPSGAADGFHWSEVIPNYESGSNRLVTPDEYVAAIEHDRAKEGFTLDMGAMEECDTCVLLLPCGKSAHLEAGWFAGQADRRLAIFLNPFEVEAELMYKMADLITWDLAELNRWLIDAEPIIDYSKGPTNAS